MIKLTAEAKVTLHLTIQQFRPTALLFIALSAQVVFARPAPLSIEELRRTHFAAPLVYERPLAGGPGFSAYLVSYRPGALKLYALVAVPNSECPAAGYPVLVANHGTHPNPPNYGFSTAGVDSRPGDYYRSVPALYASRGFLVVMSDYRGHNISEGQEFAKGYLASAYYSEDILALLSGLSSLEHADYRNVFMWGHSLGGDIWAQAYHYARYQNQLVIAGDTIPNSGIDALRRDIQELGGRYAWETRESGRDLEHLRTPLIIHHSIEDGEVPYSWSERLAEALHIRGRPYMFYSYAGSDHFLQPPAQDQAADRDVAFFRSLMTLSAAQPVNTPASEAISKNFKQF